ncbi:MAG: RNA methyltransferase PUA domain-containing protein, partial [Dehalococcoidia bacterium]
MDGAAVRLPDAAARQVAQVLRMRPGDVIAVFDGSGLEWTVELTDLGR